MIFTLGHSNHPIEKFIGLLKPHGIQLLADVRSVPMSRFNPQFRQTALRNALEAAGIDYAWLGEGLGGKPHLSYAQRVEMPVFQRDLEKLKTLAAGKCTAIMCAEKEPLNCHRTLLVSRALAEGSVPVMHILADGTLKPHADVEEELLGWMNLSGVELFHSRTDRLSEAYRLRREAGEFRQKAKSG